MQDLPKIQKAQTLLSMPQKSKGRVRNATKVDKYGLHFRSKLECYTYEAFMNAGIPVEYEPKHFTLLPKFEYNQEKIRAMTYLPDFIGKGFVVECKGLMGDSFPLRWKLFKYYLKQHGSKMKCYLVRNHKQVDEMIQELLSQKNYGKEKQ